MADEKQEKSASQQSAPQRISREQALESARSLTGQSRHVVAGALAGDDRESFTQNQLERAVKDFVSRPEAGSEEAEEEDE